MKPQMRFLTFSVTLLVGLAAAASASAQVLVSSFENNLSSSLGANWNTPNSYAFTPIGATEGSSALEITHSPRWNIQTFLSSGMPLAQLASQNDYYSIDITTADAEAFDGRSPGWRTAVLIVNSNTGNWQQTDIPLGLAPDDGTSVTTTGTVDLVASGIKTAAAQYVASGGGDGTWFELFLAFMGDDSNNTQFGDYNYQGSADAADYTLWRDQLGGEPVPNVFFNETVSIGSVDAEDYEEWKANFGADYRVKTIIDNVRFSNTPPAGLGAGVVPEPSSALLACGAAIVAGLLRRTRV